MAVDSFSPLEYDIRLAQVFTPHAPLRTADLFAGRTDQFRAATDTVKTVGLHAIIFGDRGVGKTSLSFVIADAVKAEVGIARVSCSQSDTFESVVRRALDALAITGDRQLLGFGSRTGRFVTQAGQGLPPGNLTPGAVAQALVSLPPDFLLIVDDLDRLPRIETAGFADLIKTLSDVAAPVTLLLVGVARSVDSLLDNHGSVARCLRQIRLPRMSDEELAQIVDKGYGAAGFELESAAPRDAIVSISQGFPHFTHLLALYAGRVALDDRRITVTLKDVEAGVAVALVHPDWHEDYLTQYMLATSATKRDNLWRFVVAACALAPSDERSDFSSRGVIVALQRLMNRSIRQQTIAFHLGKLTEEARGPLLERSGGSHQYRYRFVDPMMRPYITMRAQADGIIGATRSPGSTEASSEDHPTDA
jgi:hypothetical protein